MRLSLLTALAACAPTTAPETPAGVDALIAIDTFDTFGGWHTGGGGGPQPLPGPHFLATPGNKATILSSDAMCWLLVDDPADRLRVDVLSLQTRTRDVLTTISIPGAFAPQSLIRRQDKLIVAGRAGGQQRVIALDAATGAVISHRAAAVTEIESAGGYLFDGQRLPGTLDRYDDVQAVLAGRRTSQSIWSASVWGSGDAYVPGTWHSTDTVQLFDPTTFALVRQVRLDGHDTWVRDVQLDARHIYILDRGNAPYALQGGHILGLYHPTAGANQLNVELTGPAILGMTCFDRTP